MTEFSKILDRMDISHIAAYFLYGSEPTSVNTDSYEERISASYKEVYTKLEALFPTASRTNETLQDIISDFALVHSDVYLQVGVLIGFQLYKVLETGYHSPKAEGIDKVMKNFTVPASKSPKSNSNDNSLLESFFEERQYNALENALNDNTDYQNAQKELETEIDQLEHSNFSQEQKDIINKIISASNAVGSEYGTAAYRQGFYDARRLLMELLSITCV